MGEAKATLEIRGVSSNGHAPERILALADTGATLTLLPSDLLARAGVKPDGRTEVKMADGRKSERKTGHAWVTIQGESTIIRVLFGEPGDAALLGLTALEALGFTVDPVNRVLIPTAINLLSLSSE